LMQDKTAKAKVKEYKDDLAKLMNLVKAAGQRLAEQQKKMAQQNGNGQQAETQAKLQGQMMLNQAKAKNMRDSHAQRTAERQLQFEQQMKQDAQRHNLDMAKTVGEAHATAHINRMKSLQE
jgi:hypothetical protein